MALPDAAFGASVTASDLKGSDQVVNRIARRAGVQRFDHGRPADTLLRRRGEFLPRLIALHAQGRFPFDRMLRRYPFSEINAALADSESGNVVKPVLVM